MNKRILAKKNKQSIQTLLSALEPFSKTSRESFGDGYFLFSFGRNTVCHFGLKNFPEWKFGIWLDKNGYKLFGDHLLMINKFKPTATPFSVYIEKGSEKEALIAITLAFENQFSYYEKEVIDRYKEKSRRCTEMNYKNLQFVKKEMKEFSTENYYFEIKDQNTKYWSSSPRFEIELFHDSVSEEVLTQAAENLLKALEEGLENDENLYDIDDFVIPYLDYKTVKAINTIPYHRFWEEDEDVA